MTVDQAYEWWAGTLHEILAPQPFAYTRDDPIRAIRGFIDLRAADHPARQMLLPEESAFFPRLYVGMYTLFATLQVTLPARSIYDDLDGIADREPRWASNTTPGYADAACRADWKAMTIPSAHALRIPWNAESSATEARIGRQGGEVMTTAAMVSYAYDQIDQARTELTAVSE